jgi:hypothetical protein
VSAGKPTLILRNEHDLQISLRGGGRNYDHGCRTSASAKSKMSGCSEAGMAKAEGMMMKMPEGENKTMAMQEMTAAKSSMSQQDMAGCSMHMSKAMKMTSMKPKKM